MVTEAALDMIASAKICDQLFARRPSVSDSLRSETAAYHLRGGPLQTNINPKVAS